MIFDVGLGWLYNRYIIRPMFLMPPDNSTNMRSHIRVALPKFLTKLFFPSFCINCRKETPEEPASIRWLCFNCHKFLTSRWVKSSLLPEINEAYHLFDYQKDILAQKLIHAFKYNLVKEISDVFAVVLEKERLALKKLNFDVIVPIPLHKRRLKERGFNQSYLIAQKIGAITQKEIADNVLIRQSHRRPQAEIKKRAEREKNIQNIFSCAQPDLIKNKAILLVDDVATTGATLKECARVLKTSGAARIISFTLAQD